MSILRKFLIDGDYKAILAHSSQIDLCAQTADDLYVMVRAHCICGDYHRARELLERHEVQIEVHGYAELIRAQIRAFDLQDLDTSFLELLRVRDHLSRDPYILGEYYFTLGLLCNQQTSYQQGITYFEMAKSAYLEAGLPSQASIAIFNLGLSAHHLRRDAAFQSALAELARLASSHPGNSIELAFVKLSAHYHIHQEEFSLALPGLERAMTLSRSLSRERDFLSAFSFLVYVLAKTDQLVRLNQLLTENQAAVRSDSYYGERIREIESLSKIGLVSESFAKKKAEEWCRKLKDPVTVVLLLDLLLERCMRSSLYECSRRLAKKGARYSVEQEQSISLVDWRHYEIQCLLALGQSYQARILLAQYRKDAEELKSEVRLSRCKGLETQLGQADREFETSPQVHSMIEIELDLNDHRIHVLGMNISLVRKPTLEKFLKALAKGRSLSFDDIMRDVYGTSYAPGMHMSRIHSLIDRTRELLSITDLIVRSDGRISLRPDVVCHVREARASTRNADFRRKKLFEYIRSHRDDVTMMQLESTFSHSRRTLQGDLSELIKQGMVRRLGQKRSVRYQIAGETYEK